jgi:hypothetical protein
VLGRGSKICAPNDTNPENQRGSRHNGGDDGRRWTTMDDDGRRWTTTDRWTDGRSPLRRLSAPTADDGRRRLARSKPPVLSVEFNPSGLSVSHLSACLSPPAFFKPDRASTPSLARPGSASSKMIIRRRKQGTGETMTTGSLAGDKEKGSSSRPMDGRTDGHGHAYGSADG